MEAAEKFSYRTEQFNAFGLRKAPNSELYCVAGRTKAFILELIYSHHCDERIFMEQSTFDDITKFIPSHGVPKSAANIFNRATKAEQDRLMVDYHLMSEELKVSAERIAITQVRWSPRLQNAREKHYLAYLTNFGGCEIRQKHLSKLSWCTKIYNVAREWMILCQKNMKYLFNTFDQFQDGVQSVRITAIAWNNFVLDETKLNFCFATANGTIAFCDIGITSEIRFSKKVQQKHITCMEWFTIDDVKHKQRHSYVIACSVNGTISLLSVQYDDQNHINDVSELAELSTDIDGIAADGIQLEYLSKDNQLIVIACKGVNVFAYLFNIDNQTITSKCFHYVGYLSINGITRRNPLEYVVGTLSGHLECLHIKIVANVITIESEKLQLPNGHSKYALYGIASSTNNAFLLGAYFAGRPYDHLALREAGHIAVCHQLGGQNSLDMLLNNSAYNLLNTQDLAEAIRNAQLRSDNVFESYLSIYPPEVVMTDEYIYSLKVRLIVTSARSTYLRQKNRLLESGNFLGEYNILKKFIFAIQSYKLLIRFKTNYKKLSQFEKLSAQYHRASLKEFINLDIFEEYEAIRIEFRALIEKLLIAMDKFNDDWVDEMCAYCDEPVDRDTSVCGSKHELPRCCISLVHIPMDGQHQCQQCQSVALGDTAKLKLIMPTQCNDQPICPLCDLPMDRPHLSYIDYSD